MRIEKTETRHLTSSALETSGKVGPPELGFVHMRRSEKSRRGARAHGTTGGRRVRGGARLHRTPHCRGSSGYLRPESLAERTGSEGFDVLSPGGDDGEMVTRNLLLVLVFSLTSAESGAQSDRREKRARPPEFSAQDKAVFFDDPWALLVGPRPDFATQKPAEVASAGSGDASAGDGGFAWSGLISSDVYESEIKRQAQAVSGLTTAATSFKGGGYRDARTAFSVLAVMFAIGAEHDSDPRWRDAAPALRDLLSRAGANCKVGTDQSYREAAARAQDLADLVRGGRPASLPTPNAEAQWGDVADRVPLMKRMDEAEKKLGPMLGSARSLSAEAEDAAHEAQVLAALAQVITQQGFVDAGDETYDGFAHALREAAVDLSGAAEQEDYDRASRAKAKIGQACNDCHELYRG